jgi:hypothetical protein
MHLNRTTNPNPKDGDFAGEFSNRFAESRCSGNMTVATSFPRYGLGIKHQSDFEVHVTWDDVEKILEIFCKSNHPEAIAIREAQRLAIAAKSLGWRPPTSAE